VGALADCIRNCLHRSSDRMAEARGLKPPSINTGVSMINSDNVINETNPELQSAIYSDQCPSLHHGTNTLHIYIDILWHVLRDLRTGIRLRHIRGEKEGLWVPT
jgi:hypothetical protein